MARTGQKELDKLCVFHDGARYLPLTLSAQLRLAISIFSSTAASRQHRYKAQLLPILNFLSSTATDHQHF